MAITQERFEEVLYKHISPEEEECLVEEYILPSVDKALLERAISIFGCNVQIDKTIEEMSELTKALLKERHSRMWDERGHIEAILNVTEEIADVCIMLNQLMIIFDEHYKVLSKESVQRIVEQKQVRLKSRL